MLIALEKAPPCMPINLGGAEGVTIKQVAETIAKNVPIQPRLSWDITKPTGDSIRILSTKRAESVLGFTAKTTLSDGIKKTVEWYLTSKWYEKKGK